jgi:hypothetical protein
VNAERPSNGSLACEGATTTSLPLPVKHDVTSSASKARLSTSLAGNELNEISKEGSGIAKRSENDDDGLTPLPPPLLESPVVGQLYLKK